MHPVARIAQSVEQRIENPRVPGSIPGSGTNVPFKLKFDEHLQIKSEDLSLTKTGIKLTIFI